jgi:ribosomal protein S8
MLMKAMSLSTLTEEKICVMGRVLDRTEIREEVITDLLNTLPIPYKYMAEKGKKPEIPNTESTRTLVGILKNKGYISTFSETDKGIRVNTKMK